MKSIALFFVVATAALSAASQNINQVGQVADASAKTMWAAASGTTLPQAPGIVSVLTSGSQYQIDFTGPTLPAGTYVVGEIIGPNGVGISTDTYYLPNGAPGAVFLELWNGIFPAGWPTGTTQFRALVSTNGSISAVSANVSVNSCCATSLPEVISITPWNIPNQPQTEIVGKFSVNAHIGVNGIPVPVIGASVLTSQTGQANGGILIATPTLDGDNGVLTVCDKGVCSQTFFHLTLPATAVALLRSGKQ